MFDVLWRRHNHPGLTGSYHGDMAAAFEAMLADPECDPEGRRRMMVAVHLHMTLERTRTPDIGRKWFCERWGTAQEREAFRSAPQENRS